jgi:uncharacterized membrane protein
MVLTQGSIAVGIFPEPAQARHAIEELRQDGYSDNELGYLVHASTTEPDETTQMFITNGMIEGGLVGGLIGAVVALFIPGLGPIIAGGLLAAELGGVTLGAAAGSLLSALISIGIPEREARHYQRALEAGHIVVTVIAQSGDVDALRILRRNGAYEVTTRLSEYNASLQ